MSAPSVTMLRRNVKHTARDPLAVFNAVLFPIVMMLMFVFVLGGAFDFGVHYVDYATPGLIMMALSYGLSVTALAVNSDMTGGIINRLKVMDISGGAVLAGHLVASVLRTCVAVVAVVGVALLVGFRPAAGLLHWLAALGLIVAAAIATSWLAIAFGLAARSPESAGMMAVPLIMLPFLSSAFVPAATMAPGVRQFAQYQPFTPIIESLRALLQGTAPGADGLVALAWCAGIGLAGCLWALRALRKQK